MNKFEVKTMFDWFAVQDASILRASLIVLEFLNNNRSYTFETNVGLLINMIILSRSSLTFKRIVNIFDWANPIQSIQYSNYEIDNGDFDLPVIDTNSRTSGNTFSTTGTVTIGGFDYLNSDILKDKFEYFYRSRVMTHAPKEWGIVSGLVRFPIVLSGGSLLDSGYELNNINNIKYYGRYFTFIKTPKVPICDLLNLSNGVMIDNSSSIRWNGVGDSDRLEIQYLSVYSSDTPYDSYTAITESVWTATSATTINVPARKNVGDEYIYTIQTTLEPDTYYWWRLKNFRSKVSIFGHNQECFTSTIPEVFKTGNFVGSGRRDGEISQSATAPVLIVENEDNISN
jgi:hypothetical protein